MKKMVCRTNSSWEAARAKGTRVEITPTDGGFRCVATHWSRWEGDETKTDAAVLPTLQKAREWAEAQCSTRPSFGDVEWVE